MVIKNALIVYVEYNLYTNKFTTITLQHTNYDTNKDQMKVLLHCMTKSIEEYSKGSVNSSEIVSEFREYFDAHPEYTLADWQYTQSETNPFKLLVLDKDK